MSQQKDINAFNALKQYISSQLISHRKRSNAAKVSLSYVVPICLRKGQSWRGKGRSTLCANDHLVQGSAGSSSCTSKGGVGCKRRRRSWLPSLWGQGSRSPHQLFLTLFPKTNIPDGFPRLLLALKTFSFKVVLRVNNLQKL